MQAILKWLTTEEGLALVGIVAAAIWGAMKSSRWAAQRREHKAWRAVEAVEEAVSETYTAYVQELKRGREDGILTAEEVRAARENARRLAMVYALNKGIGLLQLWQPETLSLEISKAVQRLKGREVS